MEPRDDDIEFDFFDDEPTGEAQSTQSTQRVRLPGRGGGSGGGRRRSMRPPHGAAPLLRLLGLVVFLIALVLILVLVVQSCAANSRHDAYSDYMDDVGVVGSQSQANGRKLVDALTTPGTKVADLEATLRGIAEREGQNVRAAEDIRPPGRLRDQNRHVVEALAAPRERRRRAGRRVPPTANSSSRDAGLLAGAADRFIASDVVWDDLFREPATSQLEEDGVTGVAVPDSNYIQNRDLLDEESMANVLKRLRGATKGGTPTGLHGTNIVSTKALPATRSSRPTTRTSSPRAPTSRSPSRSRTPATRRRSRSTSR